MIVKCEQCQTRFKIPDEKVTDKGVKVRCTRCGHTFRVTRESNADATVVGPAPVPRPAVPSAPDPDPFARFGAPMPVDQLEQTKPGMFALGVEASRIPELSRNMPAIPPAPSPFPMPEVETVPSASLGFGGPSGFDPAAFAPPPAVAPVRPVPAAAAPAPFDFAALTAPPAPRSPAASAAPSPFDFAALGVPGSAAPPAFDFGAAATAPVPSPADPFSSAALGAGAPAPYGQAGSRAPHDPPPAPQSNPFANAAPPSPGHPADAGADPFAAVGGFGDLMSAAQSGGGSSAPEDFSAPGAGLTSEAARAMFDLPSTPAAPPQALPDIGLPPPEVTQLTTAPAPAPEASPVKVTRATAVQRAPEAPSRGRGRFVSIAVNLGIAVVLVGVLVVVVAVFANEGKLDAASFSPERLATLFSPQSGLVATDISNGLYETQAGRPVFFVRGEIHNTGATAVPVKVRAEILEGSSLVRAVEGYAGSAPSPEELKGLQTPDDLERLLARQLAAAKPVEPGATAPFVVAFFEYPPDLKAFRIRVATAAAPAR